MGRQGRGGLQERHDQTFFWFSRISSKLLLSSRSNHYSVPFYFQNQLFWLFHSLSNHCSDDDNQSKIIIRIILVTVWIPAVHKKMEQAFNFKSIRENGSFKLEVQHYSHSQQGKVCVTRTPSLYQENVGARAYVYIGMVECNSAMHVWLMTIYKEPFSQ